jgi:general secretion pathway protein G
MREVSKRAADCPHCGAPLSTPSRSNQQPSAFVQVTPAEDDRASNPLSKILAVLVIITLMSGGFGAYYLYQQRAKAEAKAWEAKAEVVATQHHIDSLNSALLIYELDNGLFPSTEQGLQALITQPSGVALPNWKGPYLDPPVIVVDLWGHAYIYKCPGVKNPNGYDLYSPGPNGIEGDDDDIGNWQ